MNEEKFADRLLHLRLKMGVSARDMSLSIGQNPGYINNIETGKSLPSMKGFFFICEFLGVTPMEFFDFDTPHPKELDLLCNDLCKLSDPQFESIRVIVSDLAKNRHPGI